MTVQNKEPPKDLGRDRDASESGVGRGHRGDRGEPQILASLRADNRRLRLALRGYHKHDPQDCADAPCVSHMAYNELVAFLEAEGYVWNDEAETWEKETMTTKQDDAVQTETALPSSVAAVGAQAAEQGEPDPALIESMCYRYDHGHGLRRHRLVPGDTISSASVFREETDEEFARRQESTRSTMRQLWEEVVGRGFYRPQPSPPQAEEE